MEWCDDNRYNPFNSYKGLLWEDSHYKPIRSWFKGEGPLPPPIEISFDICHNCNFKCPHCNSQRHTNRNKGVLGEYELLQALDLFKTLGAKAVCFGGGGEPTLNEEPLVQAIEWLAHTSMESAVATNGLKMDSVSPMLTLCKWVAVSVDAATEETFEKVHGVRGIMRVRKNTKKLIKEKKEYASDTFISFRFLITPDNWKEIERACRLAKGWGVDAFHARPADLGRSDVPLEVNYDTEQANLLLDQCHELETEDFKVVTARHKFGRKFEVIHPFKKCVASPLVLQACADGNSYVCPDHKLEDKYKLCKTMDIRGYWGTDSHRELLQGIDVDKECSRCTWGEYARQIETLEGDPMHRCFP